MNYDIIALLVMVFSFLGMTTITVRKIPAIVKLPNNSNFVPRREFKEIFTKKSKDVMKKRYFGVQILLQKTLSRTRIVILRLDNKILVLNQKLKERSKKTKEDFEFSDIKNKFKNK